MKEINFTSSYPVGNGNSDIWLTITIGDGQMGASNVKLDRTNKGLGIIENLSIGNAQSVRGKTLHIKTVVTDINDKTNETSVTYTLNGGAVPYIHTLNAVVEEQGASINYYADIDLI